MSALAPLSGLPVAFKLGTALGVFLLPLCAYAGLRLMGFRFPAPLLGAAAALRCSCSSRRTRSGAARSPAR